MNSGPRIGARTRNLCALLFAITIWLSSPLFAQTQPKESDQKIALVSVPFVGCKSDGQGGPVDAPEGAVQTLSLIHI